MNAILLEAIKPVIKKNLVHLDTFLGRLKEEEQLRHKEAGEEGTFSLIFTTSEGISYLIPIMLNEETNVLKQVNFVINGELKTSISLVRLIQIIIENA